MIIWFFGNFELKLEAGMPSASGYSAGAAEEIRTRQMKRSRIIDIPQSSHFTKDQVHNLHHYFNKQVWLSLILSVHPVSMVYVA